MSIILARPGTIVLLVTPAAVKLSVWIGLFGWGNPIEMRVCLWGIISLVVTNRAASSDLAADAITNLMIWGIERTVLEEEVSTELKVLLTLTGTLTSLIIIPL